MLKDKRPPLPESDAQKPAPSRTWIAVLFNLYLFGFFLKGAASLSLLALARFPTLQSKLAVLSTCTSLAVGLLLFLLLCLLCSFRKLPWRALTIALLASIWSGFGLLPLPGLLSWDNLALADALMSFALGLLTFSVVRNTYGDIFFPTHAFRETVFSWKRTLKSVLVQIILVPATLVYVGVSCALMLDWTSAGFLRLGWDGLHVEARTYKRDQNTVYLLPTVHVASAAFYQRLLEDLPRTEGVLLQEGVTDRKGILKRGLSYAGPAQSAGLVEQPDFARILQIPVAHFDADISDFAPGTQKLLTACAGMLEHWEEVRLAELLQTTDQLAAPDFTELKRDILSLRNAIVVGGIAKTLREYRHIFVPWGAAHMPGIEAGLRRLEFEHIQSRDVLVFSWKHLIPALR